MTPSIEDLQEALFDGCPVSTPEQNRARLEELERQLAQRHSIEGDVREALKTRVKSGEIPEDELVMDWLDALSWYLDDERDNS